jgi:hypothetical protein
MPALPCAAVREGRSQVDNVPATAFATRIERLLRTCLPANPDEQQLRCFARALRELLGDHIRAYPLCGVGALPTCCGSSNYIPDMSVIDVDIGSEFERHLQLATSKAVAEAGTPGPRTSVWRRLSSSRHQPRTSLPHTSSAGSSDGTTELVGLTPASAADPPGPGAGFAASETRDPNQSQSSSSAALDHGQQLQLERSDQSEVWLTHSSRV